MTDHNKIIVDVVGSLAHFAMRCREIPGGAHFYAIAAPELVRIIWNLTEQFTPGALTLMIRELDKAVTMEEVLQIVERAQGRGTSGN